jgi:hypothetical protein
MSLDVLPVVALEFRSVAVNLAMPLAALGVDPCLPLFEPIVAVDGPRLVDRDLDLHELPFQADPCGIPRRGLGHRCSPSKSAALLSLSGLRRESLVAHACRQDLPELEDGRQGTFEKLRRITNFQVSSVVSFIAAISYFEAARSDTCRVASPFGQALACSAFSCFASQPSTMERFHTLRRPRWKLCGPSPIDAQYRQVDALVPVSCSSWVAERYSLSTSDSFRNGRVNCFG